MQHAREHDRTVLRTLLHHPAAGVMTMGRCSFMHHRNIKWCRRNTKTKLSHSATVRRPGPR